MMPEFPQGRSGPGAPDYDRKSAEALDRLDDARAAQRRYRRRWLVIWSILGVSMTLLAIGLVLGHDGAAAGIPGLVGIGVGLAAAIGRLLADRGVPPPRDQVRAAERHHRNVTMGWE